MQVHRHAALCRAPNADGSPSHSDNLAERLGLVAEAAQDFEEAHEDMMIKTHHFASKVDSGAAAAESKGRNGNESVCGAETEGGG